LHSQNESRAGTARLFFAKFGIIRRLARINAVTHELEATMRQTVLLSLPFTIALSFAAYAAGGSDDTPPKPTRTTTECSDGQIYDEDAKACVAADKQSFNDDDRYDAVRELAYAGAYDRAEAIMASADQPNDPRFLNYRGFIARKQGDMAQAMEFYTAALAIDPDYLLARSYMGQGLAASGDMEAAKDQLSEIALRGGRETWAYVALKLALSGQPSSY
jgi:tetratricopeptide (TPR) repeat protein